MYTLIYHVCVHLSNMHDANSMYSNKLQQLSLISKGAQSVSLTSDHRRSLYCTSRPCLSVHQL